MGGIDTGGRPLVSVEEAGLVLGLSRATMYRSIRKGDLPVPLLRISGRWRIPRRALERLVESDPMAAKPTARPAESAVVD